jgi:outer membrane protein assembly factor BamB
MWSAIVLMVAMFFVTSRVVDVSIAKMGMGFLFYILAIPILCLAFVVWAVVTRHLSNRLRRVTMVATILFACGVWTLVRSGGITINADSDLKWRWAKTPEERLLAKTAHEPMTLPSVMTTSASGSEWPGFRGPNRDGIIHGKHIETDWSVSPPHELWRRAIGPGWSSFAVQGDLFYTQEQRGDDEAVSCYNITTGEPKWIHRDATRFWEANAGAGPRGTPTLLNGRVYTFGATGIVNALNAADGSVVWSHNAATDTKVKVPIRGFASLPLLVNDVVIVSVSGTPIAYNTTTGQPI